MIIVSGFVLAIYSIVVYKITKAYKSGKIVYISLREQWKTQKWVMLDSCALRNEENRQ